MRNFDHTVGVLVKAYFNNKLTHNVCYACAVGNIVAEACPDFHGAMILNGWARVFMTTDNGKQNVYPNNYAGEPRRQIDATGYTWQELAQIEKAFEKTDTDSLDQKIIDQARFNGLMAVVDVLAEIHGIDLKAKEEAKALFVKA